MVVLVAKDGVVGASVVEKVLISIRLSLLLYSFLCVCVSKDWLTCVCVTQCLSSFSSLAGTMGQ